MPQPENNRPPANYLDPAIKAMAYIAGSLLTFAIVREGIVAQDAVQNDHTSYVANVHSSRGHHKQNAALPKQPAVSVAPSRIYESNSGVVDYIVPLGIVTAEVVGLAYGLNERRQRRNSFNQPFIQPSRECYPLLQEEVDALYGLEAQFKTEL